MGSTMQQMGLEMHMSPKVCVFLFIYNSFYTYDYLQVTMDNDKFPLMTTSTLTTHHTPLPPHLSTPAMMTNMSSSPHH